MTSNSGIARFERLYRSWRRSCPTAGGLGVALARSFKIIDPHLKNPQTLHWDRADALFDLLL